MGRIHENNPDHAATRDGSERERELERAHRARKIKRYRSVLLHWMGRWLRRPRRPHVAPLPSVVSGQVGISFAGHATVLLRYANRRIVCDPMLGRWVKGVKRATMPGLTPADLHDIDVILISHGHVDHLHRPTLATLPKSATVVLPPRTGHLVSDLGFARVVELSAEQSIQDHGVDISTVSVRHGNQETPTLGYVIRGQGPSVFFCGDSGYFSGFADIGARYAPDIAILPIGGYAPLSFRDRHMSPLDALYALEDLGARIMIPVHHGAFALSYERLEEPSRWLAELVEERRLQDFVVTLEPGESRVFVPPRVKTERDPLTSQDGDTGSGGSNPALQAHAGTDAPGEMAAVAERALLDDVYGADAAEEARPIFLHALPETRAAERMHHASWRSDPPWAAKVVRPRARTVKDAATAADWSPMELWSDHQEPVPEELEGEDTNPVVAASEAEIEGVLAAILSADLDDTAESADIGESADVADIDGPASAFQASPDDLDDMRSRPSLFDELADLIDRELAEESGAVAAPTTPFPEPIPEEISEDVRVPHHFAAALF